MAGQSGFTLVELIMVLVITGILGAFAAQRFFDRATFDAVGFANQAGALIRYGQKQAIAQNRNVFVRLDGASVALCYDAACASTVVPPGGSNSGNATTLARCGNRTNWACEGLPNGLAMSSANTFFFDAAGRPFQAADGVNAVDSTFASLALTVSGNGISQAIAIEAETGYVR